MDLAHTLHGETLLLLPERAIFWPRRSTLLIADLHWGKAATFRAAGVALPGGTTSDSLARLDELILRTGADRIVFLGDLIHAKQGRASQTLAAVAAWRERHRAADLLLVRGNHDAHAGDPPEAWGIEVVDAPYHDPPFALCHHPQEVDQGYALAGHLHPAAALSGGGRQQIRLPCFWFGPRVGVLPAFGSFTGSATITPAPGDQVFVVADDEVVRVG